MNEEKHSSASVGLADATVNVMGRFKLGSARLEATPVNRKPLGFWSR